MVIFQGLLYYISRLMDALYANVNDSLELLLRQISHPSECPKQKPWSAAMALHARFCDDVFSIHTLR